jgi:hypothetical protein
MKSVGKPYNPAARIAAYCWFGAVVGIGVFFYPVVFTVDSYGVAPTLFMCGIIVFSTALVSGIVFTRIASIFRAMFSGKDLLVHWTYSQEEWSRYTELEHRRNWQEKWSLFRLVAIIALVVGVGFVIFKHDAWQVMLVIIPGLIALIALVAFASVAATYRQNRKRLGEVYIGMSGAILGHSLHYWKLPGSFLHSVSYMPGDAPYLELVYTAQSGTARGIYTARIPVPQGRENEVEKILTALSSAKENN